MLIVGTTVAVTDMVIPELLAVAGVAHAALDVRMHVTTSPFASVDEVNVVPPAPAFIPFTCHWYVGVAPPFVGVAVNVTDEPAHTAPAGLAAILTAGVTVGFTVIVIPELVAVKGAAQGELDVMIQETVCPFVKVDDVYVVLFVPTLLPFTCH